MIGIIALLFVTSMMPAGDTVEVPVRQRAEEIREVRTQNRLERKENAAEIRQQLLQEREEFREKVKTLKDERKQKIIEHIDERIQKINSNWTERWRKILARLAKILAKIESRSGETEAVILAKEAIATAESAVEAQSLKIYVINFSSEDNLGKAARTAIGELRADLKSTREQITMARKAVVEAAKEYRNANSFKDEE